MKFLDILVVGRVKIHQIPHVIFETRSHFFFKLCVTVQCHEITLLHFFSNDFYNRSPSNCKNSDFGLHRWNLYFDRFLLLKVYKISAKKVQKSYVSWYWKSDAKFEEKLICCFKNDKNLVNFDPSTQKSHKFALWLVPIVQSI